jgi:uncharacterized protein YjiS (DUF1127 family)
MSRAYLATIIAVFVTTSLATNLLLIGARGPVAFGIPARLRFRRRLSRRIRRFLDTGVDAMIARRERQATSIALRHLDDRALRDIGLYRDSVGNISDIYADCRGEASISRPAKRMR